MQLTFILLLAVAIICFSILAAFGKGVGAGASLSQIFPQKPETSNTSTENSKAPISSTSNVLRTIAGGLFALLLLYPSLVFSGQPKIIISDKWQVPLFLLLVALEVFLFFVIWAIDRKQRNRCQLKA